MEQLPETIYIYNHYGNENEEKINNNSEETMYCCLCTKQAANTERDRAGSKALPERCNVPFILAECSDILAEAVGNQIMKNNIKSTQSLFNTSNAKNANIIWHWIDDDGTDQMYEDVTQTTINEQFKEKYAK